MNIAVLLFALSAYPGQAVVVDIPFEPELEAVTLAWQAQEIRMAPADSGWFALLGVDLDVAPGSYEIDAVFRYADHRQEHRTLALTVTPKEYPTTRLTVEPKYVEVESGGSGASGRRTKSVSTPHTRRPPLSPIGRRNLLCPFQV